MKSMILGVLALMSLSAAAESYPECVIGKLAAARQSRRCNFEGIQTPVMGANLAFRPLLIDMLTPGVDMNKLIATMDGLKASADAQTEALLNAELKSCNLGGEIKVAKGGLQIQVVIISK